MNDMMSVEEISKLIKDVPNFPKEGIIFKDITPILENATAFQSLAYHFTDALPNDVTKLVAIESRGFILGAAISQHIRAGLVLVRKPGKLPREIISHSYSLEYGEDTLQVHRDQLSATDRVVIIDDVLATGGTAHATETLCKKAGAHVLGHQFLLEIKALRGRDHLHGQCHSFVQV